MSKKIVILAKYASSKREGFETRTFTLARKFVQKGYKVDLVTSDSNHLALKFPNFNKIINKEEVDGISVFWIKTLKYKKTNSIRRVLSWFDFELKFFLLCRNQITYPDIIIATSLSPFSIINGIFLKRKFKKAKIFSEIRDIWPLTLTEEGGYSKYHPFAIFLGVIEKLGYKKSDVVVGTMPNLSEHVYNITRDKSIPVHCIPFGADTNDYYIDPKLFQKDQDLSKFKKKLKGKFTIGYAGSIGLSNGLDCLIRVIKQIENPKINFVFLGEGGLRKKYQQELKGYNNVYFTGKVKREKVKYYLNLFDVLYFSALPSKVWDYGWSLNKMIDYMMAGKPVLAAYDGHKSMINEANCGFFIQSNNEDQLKLMIDDLAHRETCELSEIGKKGTKWIINNRMWDTIAENYINLF